VIKEAIQHIIDMARPTLVEVGERAYSTVALSGVQTPVPRTIGLRTLSGLIDYLAANIDDRELANHILHVESPTKVALFSCIVGVFGERNRDVEVEAMVPVIEFNRFMPIEQFIIILQSLFVQDDGAAAVLRVVGNITENATVQTQDDGVTQETTARAGIARVTDVAVPNPVELAPFRTFAEIEQPRSKFVLRIRRGAGIEAALFEADGGAWRLEAIKRIAVWLTERGVVPKVVA
jgi:hypothetical protein